MSALERLAAGTIRTDNGCLIWTKALKDDGYGVIFLREETVDGVRKQVFGRTHVLAWESVHGPVPPRHGRRARLPHPRPQLRRGTDVLASGLLRRHPPAPGHRHREHRTSHPTPESENSMKIQLQVTPPTTPGATYHEIADAIVSSLKDYQDEGYVPEVHDTAPITLDGKRIGSWKVVG